MLELNKIKNQSEYIIHNLKKRGIDVSKEIQSILDLDKKRIANQQALDLILAEGNQIAQKIGLMAKENKFDNVKKLKSRASEIKIESKKFIEKGNLIEKEMQDLLAQIPNVPL